MTVLSNEEWIEILKSIEAEEDIFLSLKDVLGETKPHVFDKWKKSDFDKNFLFDINIGTIQEVPLLSIASRNGLLNIIKKIINVVDVNKTDYKGRTALRKAVFNEHFETAKYLIEMGIDVNLAGDGDDASPLHLACHTGNIDMVKLLVASGANLNAKEWRGFSILHLAALAGHLEILKYLLDDLKMDLNINGFHPIYCAAVKGMENIVKYLIEQKNVDINTKNTCGANILHGATFSGNLELVKYLVECKNMDVSAVDRNDNTTLIYESKGNFELIKYLISKDESLIHKANVSGMLPFHKAIVKGNLDIVKYLIDEKGSDFLAAVNKHWTKLHDLVIGVHEAYAVFGVDDFTYHYELSALHLASGHGHLDIVKYLIEEKRMDCNICDQEGIAPLHLAASNGHLDIVKYLIDTHNVEPDFSNNNGLTSLHLAADKEHVEVIKYLVKDKEVPVDIRDRKNWTPLHFACRKGKIDGVKCLLDNKADLDSRDIYQGAPIHMAVHSGNFDLLKYLVEDRKADYTVTDYEGFTPLFIAASLCDLRMIKYLVEDKGVDFIQQGMQGWTALYMTTVCQCNLEIIKYFVEKGAKVNIVTEKGRSIVQGACYHGNLEAVKYLVEEKNASLDTLDENGHTPLCPAIEKGHFELAKYLIEERGLDIHVKDKGQRTVLHLAVHSGNIKTVEYLLEKDEIKKYINARRIDNRWTPLFEAVAKSYHEIARLLISKGAAVNSAVNANMPLHRAAFRCDKKMIELLLDNKANINPKNSYGDTPLHTVAKTGPLDIVKLLIERGANPNLKNRRNITPIDVAIEAKQDDIVEYLQDVMLSRLTISDTQG